MTADGNIIHARATLTYHINEPNRYIFSFVDASKAIQNALDNALLYTAARFKVDDILTRDVAGFNDAVKSRATDLIEKQDLGVVVEQCIVQRIPPRQLRDAFDNVLRAEVNRSKLLNEARSYENQVTNRASADAKSRINLAESERTRYVAEVSSRADEFAKLLPKYRDNPGLFVQRRLTETLGRVLPAVQDKIFVADSADGNSRELRLLLNREPPKAKAEETKP